MNPFYDRLTVLSLILVLRYSVGETDEISIKACVSHETKKRHFQNNEISLQRTLQNRTTLLIGFNGSNKWQSGNLSLIPKSVIVGSCHFG